MSLNLPRPPAWMESAACLGLPIETFFPPPGHPETRIAAAKAICNGCPVVAECLEFSLYDDYGVFAGLTGDERRALRVEPRKKAWA